jgi:PAS domain S-box-containing protein
VIFELTTLPSQTIFPIGITVANIALCLFVLSYRRPDNPMDHLFVLYLILTVAWNINLVFAVNNIPALLPGLTWGQLIAYGLLILGVVYWTFARAFLQLRWRLPWVWALGAIGLALAIGLDMQWFYLPPSWFTWSNGWVNAGNIGFVLSVIWWGLFMALTGLAAIIQQSLIQSSAHKNRIQYLLISAILLTTGYGLYFSLREPFWAAGLIITGIGGALTTYIVVAEDLIDLNTFVRRLISGLVVAVVTISFYITGIYLVQIFLGDFLFATFSGYVDQTLLIASVTAVLLIVVYTPIRRISQHLTNRILLGQRYSYQNIIQNYIPLVSNRLYLNELAEVAMGYINRSFGVQKSALFILDSVSDELIRLRTLPVNGANGIPEIISLKRNTPIANRLMTERRALAQYTIDISSQFKSVPVNDRQALKSLNYEWFIPIHKKGELIGIFALGAKMSKRSYTDQEMSLLNTLADQTALALENATLFDGIQRNLEQISNMKNLMDNVFDSMDNGVITTDIRGKITFYNRAAQSILGVSSNGFIGTPYTEALPSLANTIFPNLVKSVIQKEGHYLDYEIISDLPGRGRVNLSISLAPLKDAQNRTQGVTIVMDDRTETKRLQAVHDIMGIFNAPLLHEDHVLRAVRAAAAMQHAVTDFHKTIDENRHLQFGVGLHVGEVVVGNVGLSDRMDYTAIGDAVNVAKRIQESTPGGKILMSEAVYRAVENSVNAAFYQEMQAKGREEMIRTYELRGGISNS